ncbi:hypothetical protein ACFL15_01855 [Patescibacteria group bacterium]
MKKESLKAYRERISSMTDPEVARLIGGYTDLIWNEIEQIKDRYSNSYDIKQMQKRVCIAAEMITGHFGIDINDESLVEELLKEESRKFEDVIRKRWQQCWELGTVLSVRNRALFAEKVRFSETALGPYRHRSAQPEDVEKYMSSRCLGGSADGRELIIVFEYDGDKKYPRMYETGEHGFTYFCTYQISDLPSKFTGNGLVFPSLTKATLRSIRGRDKERFIFIPNLFRYSGPRKEIQGVFDPMCMFEKMYLEERKQKISYDDKYFMDFAVIAKQVDKPVIAEFTIHDINYIEILDMPSQYCAGKEQKTIPDVFYGGEVF